MEGRRTAVFAIVVVFVVIGSMMLKVEGSGEVHYNPVTISRVNESFSMNIPAYNDAPSFRIQTCIITPPKASSIRETDLLQSHMDTRIRKTTSVRESQNCGFILDPVWKTDEGNWTLKYVLDYPHNRNFEFSVVGALQVKEPNQLQEIVKREGETVELPLILRSKLPNDNRALSSCVATHPNGTEIPISPSTAYGDSRIKYSPGFENRGFKDGYCNVLLEDIRMEDSGKWTLRANSSSGLSLKREIILTVKIISTYAVVIPDETVVKEQDEVSFQLKVLETGNKTYRWESCSVKAPNGTLYYLNGVPLDGSTHSHSIEYGGGSLMKGNCGVKIENIERDMEGSWVLGAREFQSEEVISAAIIIHIRGLVDLEVEGSEYDSKVNTRMTLICKRRHIPNFCSQKPKTCIMERPNGQKILLREGVASPGDMKRYKLEGGGTKQCDCSMSIQKPLIEQDYGQWRCIMKYRDRFDGGFINVISTAYNDSIPDPSATVQRQPSNGLVRSGDPMSLECRANRPLDYCRLRSPSGEIFVYNRLAETQQAFVLLGGFGLSLGECTFGFLNADPQMHSGKWIIEVGIMKDNSTIIEQEYSVNFIISGSVKAANTSLNATSAETLVGSTKVDNLTESRTNNQTSLILNSSINSAEGSQIPFTSGLSLGLGVGLIVGVVVAIALGFLYYRFTRNTFYFGRHNSHDRVLNKAEHVELSYQQ